MDEDKETLTESYRLIQTDEMTEDMKKVAIGIQKSMFGYTFITKNTSLEGDNIKSKIPTVEELFVHLISDHDNPYSSLTDKDDKNISNGIFGL
jgi:hypothetical protein